MSCLVRALGKLPGGIGQFLPCSVGGHCPGYGTSVGTSVVMV